MRLPPEVSFYKQLGTVKIKAPPISESPSHDHDYSAIRPFNQPRLLPAPVTANIDGLPGQLSSRPESAVNPEEPPAPPPPAKKGRQVNPRNKRAGAGQSRKNYSETLLTHQYENKAKNVIQKKGNNPKVNLSVLVPIC